MHGVDGTPGSTAESLRVDGVPNNSSSGSDSTNTWLWHDTVRRIEAANYILLHVSHRIRGPRAVGWCRGCDDLSEPNGDVVVGRSVKDFAGLVGPRMITALL